MTARHLDEGFDLAAPSYTPNRLLNKVSEFFGANNDAELARALECDQALVCRMRKRKEPISAFLMVQIMDRTDWTIRIVREFSGLPYDGGILAGIFAPAPPKRKKPKKPRELKITDADVLAIRGASDSAESMAKRYGITVEYVRQIRRGKAKRGVVAVTH